MNITAQRGWAIQRFNFSNDFFQATLKEEFYIETTDMFSDNNANSEETVLLKLSKSIYVLVQAPRTWYQYLQKGLKSLELERSDLEKAIYYG